MKNIFVFTLSKDDNYQIPNATRVNINDSSELKYTFWHPKNGWEKLIYSTPSHFTGEALDLLNISLMVFYADRKVERKIQDDAWTRDIELYIPVKNKTKWENNNTLKDALNFLTGDHWKLNFRSYTSLTKDEEKYKKARNKYKNTHSFEKIDTNIFCMLSGGLDSFIGAINLLKEGEKPLFVSHYGGGKGVNQYQENVVKSLIAQYGVNSQLFFRFYAAAQKGIEDSTRSRSLMFFAHAIAIASGMNHHVDLIIPENGVISLNVPLTVRRIGSLSTRTTHPYFIGLLQKLITDLGIDVTLINPFQFFTKGEMMATCKDKKFLNNNYQNTLSCSHPDLGRWSKEKTSHCGECLPCTIRRAAIKAANLKDSTHYRNNYDTPSGKEALASYKLGLLCPMESFTAIQMSGPIRDHQKEYMELYERGIKELKDFIDSF